MTREEKAKRIKSILDALYPDPVIPLPHCSAYTLLISTILSAQCTDVRVRQVAPLLFSIADTPDTMALLPVEQIAEIIRPCGLFAAKSKAISELSKILVDRYRSEVPRTFEQLEALPGVGHKTASVVMVQAFGQPAFPVDTHIHRLAARWGLSSGKSVTGTERDLKKLFAQKDWGRLHLQLIYFGRERCPARGHDFCACPICSWAATNATRRNR
jgi:endonuclease-3